MEQGRFCRSGLAGPGVVRVSAWILAESCAGIRVRFTAPAFGFYKTNCGSARGSRQAKPPVAPSYKTILAVYKTNCRFCLGRTCPTGVGQGFALTPEWDSRQNELESGRRGRANPSSHTTVRTLMYTAVSSNGEAPRDARARSGEKRELKSASPNAAGRFRLATA